MSKEVLNRSDVCPSSGKDDDENTKLLLANLDSFVEEEILHSSTPLPVEAAGDIQVGSDVEIAGDVEVAIDVEVASDVEVAGDVEATNNMEVSRDLEVASNVEDAKDAESTGYTLDDAIDKIGLGCCQMMAFLFCGLMIFSSAMSIMSSILILASVHCQWSLSGIEESLLSVLLFSGYFFGNQFWAYLSGKIGYKSGFASADIMTVVFRLLCSIQLSPSDTRILGYPWLLLCLFGIGFGGSKVGQVVAYWKDFLPRAKRTSFSVCVLSWWCVGAASGTLLAALLISSEHYMWHWYAVLCTLPSVLVVLLVLLALESPHHYWLTGKIEKTVQVLNIMAKFNFKKLPEGKLLPPADEYFREKSLKTSNSLKDDNCHIFSSVFISLTQCRKLFTNDRWKRSVPIGIMWLVVGYLYFGAVLISVNVLQGRHTCQTHSINWPPFQIGKNESSIDNLAYNDVFDTLTDSYKANELMMRDYLILALISGAEIADIMINISLDKLFGTKLSMSANFVVMMLGFTFLWIYCSSMKALVLFLMIVRIFSSCLLKAVYAHSPELYTEGDGHIGEQYSAFMYHLGILITPWVSQALFSVSSKTAMIIYAGTCFIMVFIPFTLPFEKKKPLLQS